MLYNLFVRRSVETVDDGSVTTSVTVAEVADTQERQPQQRQQPPQSKGNVGVGRRVASQNVALSNGNGISNVGRVASRSHMEQEKRMRREIANSNERRRMQSINAGFQSLRTLLPHHEGEKLSKVSGFYVDPWPESCVFYFRIIKLLLFIVILFIYKIIFYRNLILANLLLKDSN